MSTWKLSLLVVVLSVTAAWAEDTVATVGSKTISRADLDKHVKAKMLQVESQRFQVLSEGLDELIATELFEQEAKARSIAVADLVKQEVEAKVKSPSDDEIKKVYEENKDELEGQTLETVKPQIVQYLRQQQLAERNEAFINELRKKYKTTVALKPPVVNVSDGGRTARGKIGAPITIIEFSDYECPYCKRAFTTVEQVLKTYGDKIRFVHRDFPLPFHESARPAAEAALCANAQGKFWEYQDKLFPSEDLSEAKLKSLAKDVGLDTGKFDDCLTKKPNGATIDKDVADGTEAGVNGTPAFFINGRMLSGAQPFEKFKEIIDDELARAGQKS
ncbi:MAG: thioredoxin domain-containing protein [Deltaproteobacteria bacterium]|nr:thioredoxin domain-containing protein [Deltaproteobacteria bacterium]